jgi:hypothetical protein
MARQFPSGQTKKHFRRPTLSLILWGLAPLAVHGQVIDLGAGSTDLRVQSGVLDFGKDIPARQAPRAERAGATNHPIAQGDLVLASYGTTRRSPRGSAVIEDLVLQVGTDFLSDPGLKAAGLSVTEWLALFRANIAVESGFNPEALSPVGAIGLGQLMPETAATLGVDPYDVKENLRGSARYLLDQLAAFGSADLALAAYNAGPQAVRDYGGIPPYAETEGHVSKVLALTNSTLISE